MAIFSNAFLHKTAVYIAFGGMTAVMLMRSSLKERVRTTDYFRESFKILRQHEGAKHLLGEPIKEAGFDIGDPNYANGEKAYFEVKVKGSKDRGTMYFWASKTVDQPWSVDRIELQMKGDDEKRLLIRNLEKK